MQGSSSTSTSLHPRPDLDLWRGGRIVLLADYAKQSVFSRHFAAGEVPQLPSEPVIP